MKDISTNRTNGYYHVKIQSSELGRFFRTNNERAFVRLQLQQLLAARSVLEDPLYAKSLAHHIDLLAFSISKEGVQLLAYCIGISSMKHLLNIILERLNQYQSEYGLYDRQKTNTPLTSMRKLAGSHEALSVSTNIHLLHLDWENDRYSSIGFYLHDRRGDWMKLWRLSQLYDNDTSNYRDLIKSTQNQLAHSGEFEAEARYERVMNA